MTPILFVDQLVNPGPIVVAKSHEDGLEFARKVGTHSLVDEDQGLVRKGTWELSHSVDECEGARTSAGARWRECRKKRTGVVSLDLVRRSRAVGLREDVTELMHDRDPDASTNGDLIPDAHPFEGRWEFDWSVAAEEPGVEIPDGARSIDAVQPNVKNSLTLLPVTQGVIDVQDDVVYLGVVELADLLEDFVDQLLGGMLPLSWGQIRQTLGTQDSQPILFGTIQHPIVKLSVGRGLQVETATKIAMAHLEIDEAIIVLAANLLNMIDLGVGLRRIHHQARLGLIEEIEHVVKTRDRSQVDTIGKKILGAETRQQVQVQRNFVAEHR